VRRLRPEFATVLIALVRAMSEVRQARPNWSEGPWVTLDTPHLSGIKLLSTSYKTRFVLREIAWHYGSEAE
jgi:hypothetical protein